MTILRSALAIAAGFLAMAVSVALATQAAVTLMLASWEAEPTPTYLAVNVAYSLAFAFLGGWVTARIAPRAPMLHALGLVAFMLAMTAPSLLDGDATAGNQPGWYPLFLGIGPPLAVLAGAMFYSRRGNRGDESPTVR